MSRRERERERDRERAPPGSISGEKYRDDRYRNSKDSSSDYDRDRRRRRERSRSPGRSSRRSRSRENKNYKSKERSDCSDQTDTRVREMSISPNHEEESEEEYKIPNPPPAPKIGKISVGFCKPVPKPQPIKMTLNSMPAPSAVPALKPKLASVFNDGSDEEPEEMPAEARMRMRNIGRETPTSAGPNSFGKTKHGFCDAKNIFQRNLKEAMEKVNPSPNTASKYPNTIYKFH